MTSEFGKGCVYCLGLFLNHTGDLHRTLKNYREMSKKHPKHFSNEEAVQLWMNRASDHFYELQIPKNVPVKIKNRLKKLKNECLDIGHGKGLMGERKTTIEEAHKLIQEAKDLLRWFDKNIIDVETVKGDYE